MIGNELIGNTVNIIMNASFTVVVLITTFVALTLYALKTNKGKSAALAIGVLISGAIYEAIVISPFYISFLSENINGFILNLALYLTLLFLSVVVLHKFVHGGFSHESSRKMMQIGIFSVATGGLLLTYIYQKLCIESFQDLSHFADVLFGGSYSTLIWSCALLIGLFMIHKLR